MLNIYCLMFYILTLLQAIRPDSAPAFPNKRSSIGMMLGHRLGRLSSTKTALGQRLALAES